MRVTDILIMAFLNLWRRKLRAILTVLGMAVGTTSIIVMVSIGVGLNLSVTEEIAALGNLTKIEVQQQPDDGMQANQSARTISNAPAVKLDDRAVREFKKLAHVVAVTPVDYAHVDLKWGGYTNWINLLGLDLETAAQFELIPTEGELPQLRQKNKPMVMLSGDVGNNFIDSRNGHKIGEIPEGKSFDWHRERLKMSFDGSNFSLNSGNTLVAGEAAPLKGKIYDLKITGVYGGAENGEYGNTAFMDLHVLRELMAENSAFTGDDGKNTAYRSVWMKADALENVQILSQQVREMGFATFSPVDYINSYQEQMKMVQGVLGAIGAVAMLVAGIGITNTMMTSIYERTQEIGVIKVLGCKMNNILQIFLTESAYIGLSGGCVGVILSLLLSFSLNQIIG
ncbi:MAG: ABC transporter permease, partial [Clostridiales bacterium]